MMINQQIIDFIKLQLQKGLDKETITKELIANGWSVQDIEESFSSVGNLPQATSSTLNISSQLKKYYTRNILIIIFVIIGIIVLFFGLKIYNLRNNVKITEQNQVLNPYINNEYSFSFSYPKNVLFVKEEPGVKLLKLTLYYTVQEKDYNFLQTKMPFGAMIISKQSYEQFLEKFKKSETLNNISEETIEKNGIIWNTALVTDKDGFPIMKEIITQKEGLNYSLLLVYPPAMLDNVKTDTVKSNMDNLAKMFTDTFVFTDAKQ